MSLNISYTISAVDKFTQVHKNLEQQVSGISSLVSGVGSSMLGLGAATGVASGAALGVGLNYLAGMEKAQIGLEMLTGSADETQGIMKDLQDFAVKTPFEFDGMLQGTRRLIGMGMASDEATEMLKATADAVAAAGGGSAEFDGVITALGQIQAKGKISAEEMNQLAERGIPAWKILGEEMGKTPGELMDLAANGKLLAKDALPALKKGFEDTFGGAAVAQSETFSGRLANLKEQFQIFAGALAQPLFEPLTRAMGFVVEKLQVLSGWFKQLPSGIQTFITVGLILTPVLLMIGGGLLLLIGMIPAITAGFSAIAGAVGVASGSLLTVIGVVFAVVAALVVIGIGLYQAYQKVDWFRNAVDTAWAWIKNAWNTALNFILGIVNTVISEVSGFIGEQLAKIKAFWDENGEQVMRIVKTFMTFIGENIKAGMEFIKGIFQVVWPIISGIIQVAWGLIKTIISTGIDIVLGLIKAGMDLLEGDWSGAWEAIQGIGEDIWHNIESFFANIDLVQIGKDIIQGLIDGIGSMGSAIKRKVESMASLIPRWAKDMLGINSPSKVFMEIGSFTGEGMALGIDKSIGMIRKATESMAVEPVKTANSAIVGSGTSSGTSSSGAQRIEIPLYLDGYEIARATYDYIDGMQGNAMASKMRLGGVKG